MEYQAGSHNKMTASEAEKQRQLGKTTTQKEINVAKANIELVKKKSEISGNEGIDPSALSIGISWVKSGANSLREKYNEFSGDKKTLSEIRDNEKKNKSEREHMLKNYSTGDLIEDSIEAAMWIGTGVAIGTGVGAVGIGLATAGKYAIKKGGKSLGQAAINTVKRTMADSTSKVKLLDDLEDGISSSSLIKKHIATPIKSTGVLIKNNAGKGFLAVGLPTGGLVGASIAAHETHVKNKGTRERNSEAFENAKDFKSKHGKDATVEDILDMKRGRRSKKDDEDVVEKLTNSQKIKRVAPVNQFKESNKEDGLKQPIKQDKSTSSNNKDSDLTVRSKNNDKSEKEPKITFDASKMFINVDGVCCAPTAKPTKKP